jgi:hypothetical protein
MNSLIEEYLFREHLNDLQREASNIHLQERVLKSMRAQPNWFRHTMQNLGQWLIVQGERLVRYSEAPANSCQSSTC